MCYEKINHNTNRVKSGVKHVFIEIRETPSWEPNLLVDLLFSKFFFDYVNCLE